MAYQPNPGMATGLPIIQAGQTNSAVAPTVDMLSQMPENMLLQMYARSMQPGSNIDSLNVLAAIKKSRENTAMINAIKGQQAGAAIQQQPRTVADEIVSQPMLQQAPRMMASGGIVSLAEGDPVLARLPGETDTDYEARKAQYIALMRHGNLGGMSPIVFPGLAYSPEREAINNIPLNALRGISALWDKATEGTTIEQERIRNRPDISPAENARFARSIPVEPAPSDTGYDALEKAKAARMLQAARGTDVPTAGPSRAPIPGVATSPYPSADPAYAKFAAQAKELAESGIRNAEQQGRVSPEILAARTARDEAMGKVYDPISQLLEEARAKSKASYLDDKVALGQIAAGAASAIGPGKGLAAVLGAASGAGAKYGAELQDRVNKLADRKAELTSQLNMEMAKVKYADSVGDDALKRASLDKIESIKQGLLSTQVSLQSTSDVSRYHQAQGIAALQTAAAHRMAATKPTEFEQRLKLFQSDPKAYAQMFGGTTTYDKIMDNTARDVAKELARVPNVNATKAQVDEIERTALRKNIALAKAMGANISDDLLNDLLNTVGTGTTNAIDLSKWGQANVVPKP